MADLTVSVAMSVFNGAPFLREALDNLRTQSLADWEAIVIDDGSTDGSSEILDEYAAMDSRFRIVRRPNKGLTASLNESIEQARGEFIARMDADDVSLPERFERQVDFLRQHLDHVAVGCRTIVINEFGEMLSVSKPPVDHAAIDARLIEGATAIAHPSVLMRRDAVEAVGRYCEVYHTSQDLDLFLRLAEIGRLANLELPLLKYRWHDENVTLLKADQQDRDVTAIVQAARRRRGLPPLKGVPESRWQFRRSIAVRYAIAGKRHVARKMALKAFSLRPWAIRSWYTLAGVLISPKLFLWRRRDRGRPTLT